MEKTTNYTPEILNKIIQIKPTEKRQQKPLATLKYFRVEFDLIILPSAFRKQRKTRTAIVVVHTFSLIDKFQ